MSDVRSLAELVKNTTLGQNYRINFLWNGQRTDYVLSFLAQCGFSDLNDIKTFVDHFTLKLYLKETRYSDDIEFRILTDSYHDKNSSFLPVVLKKIETRSGLSTIWGKISPRANWRKTLTYEKRLDNWLFGNKALNIDTKKFSATVARLLSYRAPLSKPVLDNFEQFISLRTLWGTSGSTDVVVDKSVPKTKWQNALLMSDSEILDLVNKHKDKAPVYSIIDKSESNTVRAVVLVDLVTYLIEGYGSYYLDQILHNHPVFYNWKDQSHRYRYWAGVVQLLQKNEWFADYDWSGWDENVIDELYQIVLSQTMELLKNYAPDFEQFGPYLGKAVNGAFLKGYKRRTTTSGLASGRRWTTYINSVFNAAFLAMACDSMGYDVLSVPDALVTLGDDSQTLLRPSYLADSITDVLDQYGAKINKQKSKITNKDPEFLKFTASSDTVTGIEIRAIRSIIWSTEEEMVAVDNVQTRLDVWTKFISRVKLNAHTQFRLDDVISLFYRDISNKTRLSIEKVKILCRTPTAINGWGLFPAEPPYLGYVFTAPEYKMAKIPKLKVPSLFGEFRHSVEALASQTLVRPERIHPGSFRIVRELARQNNKKPIGDHYVTPLRTQNFISPDRSRPVPYVTDQLWLSQVTLDQLRDLKHEPISPQLKGSIRTLLSAWSFDLTFKEVSKNEVTKPAVQRVEIIDKGEVMAGYFWSYIYSSFFLPFKTRRMDVGYFRTLLYSAQYTASHTKLVLGRDLGEIVA